MSFSVHLAKPRLGHSSGLLSHLCSIATSFDTSCATDAAAATAAEAGDDADVATSADAVPS